MASVRARLVAPVALALTIALAPSATASASTASPSAVSASAATPGSAEHHGASSATSSATAVSAAVRLPNGRISSRAAMRSAVLRGRLVIAEAARYAGIRYVAGGTSPRSGFDCSGYTRYVFSRLGISIPRVSRAQYASMIHISRAQAVPGDLVFFHDRRGRVYHAAIYAGNNSVWHSPHTGTRVQHSRIWSSAVYFARVRV
jgi:cell wall-associated NlpC family hydrolase